MRLARLGRVNEEASICHAHRHRLGTHKGACHEGHNLTCVLQFLWSQNGDWTGKMRKEAEDRPLPWTRKSGRLGSSSGCGNGEEKNNF